MADFSTIAARLTWPHEVIGPCLLINADCLAILPTLAADSIDAIVCDPPYGLAFMGKDWDHGVPGSHFWREALRVAKPGAHMLAFGGTRTFHRLACAIEDAGWEIRDTLGWVYGSGFPKSLGVSKAIDKAAGAEREVVGANPTWRETKRTNRIMGAVRGGGAEVLTAPATDAARQWHGWGTALKPAWEPIIVARKPLDGTVAENVQRYGTGAINVAGCRVDATGDTVVDDGRRVDLDRGTCANGYDRPNATMFRTGKPAIRGGPSNPQGRWPANLIHDGSDEVVAIFPQTTSGGVPPKRSPAGGYGGFPNGSEETDGVGPSSGSAARFFYCAKASRQDRNSGLDSIEIVTLQCSSWENEDQKARLRVDTAQSPPRVIDVSGAPCSDATAWSTFLFGNGTPGQSQPGSKFIIETATSSTTESKTLSWLVRSNTSDSTAGASFATASGGSHAASAEANTPCLITTSEWTVSPRGVERAASPTRWKINGNAGQPSDHPTVKPTALMRYLCRLVTPPGGIVLDPFMGSGSTGKAAVPEGFRFIGIELDADYFTIATRRARHASEAYQGGPMFAPTPEATPQRPG